MSVLLVGPELLQEALCSLYRVTNPIKRTFI